MRPGIVLHQEEPRAHCTSVRSVNRSEDFILEPNSSQGTAGHDSDVCVTLHEYVSPHHHWPITKLVMLDDVTGSITFTMALHTLSHLSHLWTERVVSVEPDNLGVLSRMLCVSTDPTSGRPALKPPSWTRTVFRTEEQIPVPLPCWCPFTTQSSSPNVMVGLLVTPPCSCDCAGRHSQPSCDCMYRCAILVELGYLWAWLNCRHRLMLPVGTRTLAEYKTREESVVWVGNETQ